MKLFWSERATRRNNHRAILSVYVGALYGTIVHIRNTHVGPVNVSGLDIYYYAIWGSAAITFLSEPSAFIEKISPLLASSTNKRPIVDLPDVTCFGSETSDSDSTLDC